jgi:hypothetical protein
MRAHLLALSITLISPVIAHATSFELIGMTSDGADFLDPRRIDRSADSVTMIMETIFAKSQSFNGDGIADYVLAKVTVSCRFPTVQFQSMGYYDLMGHMVGSDTKGRSTTFESTSNFARLRDRVCSGKPLLSKINIDGGTTMLAAAGRKVFEANAEKSGE